MARAQKLSPEQIAYKKRAAKKVTINSIIMVFLIMITGVGFTYLGLYYTFMVLIVGMLPGIVAYLVDKGKGRFASSAVMSLNFAGLSPHIAAIIESGSAESVASRVLYDPLSWLVVYGFAAAGWIIVFIVPQIFYLYLSFMAEFQITRMQNERRMLLEEWGRDLDDIPMENLKKRQVKVSGEL